MKVSFEGTAKELLDLADVIETFTNPIYTARIPKDTDASARDVGKIQAADDVPNRFREEGVQ